MQVVAGVPWEELRKARRNAREMHVERALRPRGVEQAMIQRSAHILQRPVRECAQGLDRAKFQRLQERVSRLLAVWAVMASRMPLF